MYKKNGIKYSLLIALALLIASTLTYLFVFPKESGLNFITVPVQQGALEKTVLADGTINASKLVSIGAQVSGEIKKFI